MGDRPDPNVGAAQPGTEATHRQRRLIFNDDSEELAHEGASTVDGFLDPRLKPLVGTHVDTISWSVLGIWGDAPTYDSKVQPVHGDAHGGPPPGYELYTGNLKTLIEAGRCPLQIVIDFAHDNGMEALASVRMNDVHDSFVEGIVTTWKRQHPELLVDTEGTLPSLQLYVTAQDFSNEQVRERKLEIIEEICHRYDVDGFELDYIRHPVFFSRTMRGLPVVEEEVEIMTSLMRRIRQLTDEAGARRGRELLVAARVPDTFELSMNVGLDLETWLEERLVDIMIIGGGYAPFTLPVGELTTAAHQYGVPIYPCINSGPVLGLSGGAFSEAARALAASWHQAGADGIYLWNLGTPFLGKSGEDLINTRRRFYACLAEIGDPKALVGKDKLYVLDVAPVFIHYTHVSAKPHLPVYLQPGAPQSVPLVVGDDLQAAAKAGLLAQMKLTMTLRGLMRQGALSVRLNGEDLAGSNQRSHSLLRANIAEYEIDYIVTAPPLKMGRNVIEASLRTDESIFRCPGLELCGVKLKAEYGADEQADRGDDSE